MSTLMSTIRLMNESVDTISEEVAEFDVNEAFESIEEAVEFDVNEAFEALDENLRSDIAKVASKYPEGSSVKVKGKSAKVVSHGKDFLVVSAGKETMNVDLKDVVKESVELEEGAEVYTMKKGSYTRQVDGKEADKMKKQGWKLVGRVIAEDYFTVQYYDAKGKAEEGKYKDFKDEKSAKKHLDRANKVVKDGEYKMFKVKGSMDESAELDEASYKVPKNYAAMMAKKAKKDKPYEKQIGMGDSRSEKEIRDQISGLSDDTLKQWANDPAGRFGSKIAKLQDKLVATELKKRGIVESVSESVELEEHIRKNAQNTIKGNKYDMNENSYGLTASLIAAVTGVVTGVEAVDAPPAQEPKPVELEEGAEGGTGDKEAYQKFFQAALKKFGASSPADLDDKKKKEFYDYVDANWKGDNEVAESSLKEFKADGEDSETADPTDVKAKQPKKGKKAKAESKDGDEDKKGGEKIEINPKLDEAAEMTDAQMKKREEIVLSMKDKIPEFKKKYGDRWKDVMYGTATKLAMK